MIGILPRMLRNNAAPLPVFGRDVISRAVSFSK